MRSGGEVRPQQGECRGDLWTGLTMINHFTTINLPIFKRFLQFSISINHESRF